MNLKPNIIFLLMVLQVSGMMLFSVWYLQFSSCSITPPNNNVHVLLLATGRSGSSFLGQVFNQHPDVFYLREPGIHVYNTMNTLGLRSVKMVMRDLVRSLINCDFTVMDSYLPENYNVSDLFMWSESRALCSPPACSLTPRGQFHDPDVCKVTCDASGLQGAHEACTTYSHVVLKELRFYELESLYPLFQDPSLDLYIIHLVRDPRAVERSKSESPVLTSMENAIVLEQQSLPKDEEEYYVLKTVCDGYVNINQGGTNNPPPFLKGRYRAVRYEDIVMNPIDEITALYDFVGLEMTPQLEDWIYTMTHGGESSKKDAFTISSRDAISVAQAWRTTLPHSQVKIVQQVCEGAMSLFGYKMVNSEEEQKRLDMDLLVPQELLP